MKTEALNIRVTIQTFSASRDTAGAEVLSWSTLTSLWAKKLHSSSREFFTAQKVNSEITDLFIVRFYDGITTKMRLVYGSKNYDILGADDPNGRRRELQILCKLVT